MDDTRIKSRAKDKLDFEVLAAFEEVPVTINPVIPFNGNLWENIKYSGEDRKGFHLFADTEEAEVCRGLLFK